MVTRFGTSWSSGSRAGVVAHQRTSPTRVRLGRGEVGDHRLAGHRRLADGDERRHPVGEVDVEPRAEADQPEPLAGPEPAPSATKQTMRRATSPAICTTASVRPSASSMTSPLRSLSSLALSSEAFRNLPGW